MIENVPKRMSMAVRRAFHYIIDKKLNKKLNLHLVFILVLNDGIFQIKNIQSYLSDFFDTSFFREAKTTTFNKTIVSLIGVE